MDCLKREFLDLLESKEENLLSWGIVDGGFSESELEELAEEFLNDCKALEDVWDFLEEILERRLLFELNLRGRRLYRTRMAEAVRLFARGGNFSPQAIGKLHQLLLLIIAFRCARGFIHSGTFCQKR